MNVPRNGVAPGTDVLAQAFNANLDRSVRYYVLRRLFDRCRRPALAAGST
jgi:hypothetical protein